MSAFHSNLLTWIALLADCEKKRPNYCNIKSRWTNIHQITPVFGEISSEMNVKICTLQSKEQIGTRLSAQMISIKSIKFFEDSRLYQSHKQKKMLFSVSPKDLSIHHLTG